MSIRWFVYRIALCILCCIGFVTIQAQKMLRSLDVNPVLLKYRAENPVSKLKSLTIDTLELPFRDDFSSTSILPDKRFWTDENVFINSTYADSLLSIGIATFDILGSDGKIYPDINLASFRADELTSKPINLKYEDSTHIWLSFYFLPGGLGDPPSLGDSLILEYYAPDSSKWYPQWIARNSTQSIILNNYSQISNKWDTVTLAFASEARKFKLAMAPVIQDRYRKKGFRFRFRNTASITGDVYGKLGMTDLWHIDYVYLDTGRTQKDTIYHDMTFYKPMSSVLKDYTSMPFNQFIASTSQLKSTIEFSIRNNDSLTLSPQKNIRYTEIATHNSTTQDILKDKVDGFSFYTVSPDLENPFTTNNTKNVVYEIKEFIDHLDKWPWNDTVKYIQKFLNYFSYDDSTSEGGYGMEDMNGIVAYGFNTYESDTLTGVKIFFNPTLNDVNKSYYFKLAVWANNKGKPGVLLYKDKAGRQPVALNEFDTYALDSAIFIKDTRFYVGWYQVDDNFLNVGYDLNTNSRSNIFINTYGQWLQAGSDNGEVLPGSLMLRPVFRSNLTTGIPILIKNTEIRISPNPATDYLTISGITALNTVDRILVFNTIGQIIKDLPHPTSETIDISSIPQGLYIVKVIFHNGTSESFKLLKK
jgi:hypothetical protein